jgi:protein SDA1
MSEEESQESEGATVFDIEAFARDIGGFSNHRDRSVSIAAKSWMNFVRATNPSLLQGKDRGLMGTALHRSGAKPSRYGAQKIAAGVEGADLLAEYEAMKAAKKARKDDEGSDDEEDDGSGEWEDVSDEEGAEESDDGSAPDLLQLDDDEQPEGDEAVAADAEPTIDISKMTEKERDLLKQKVSGGRIFSASDFKKMRKLVEREQRLKADPREAARRKRAAAKGEEFDLSEDSEEEDDEENVRITGAVTPSDIMAEISRRRQNKAERLEKVTAGRSSFETKERPGGSTNVEKKRKKNFVMTKNSREARTKGMGKKTAVKRPQKQQIGHLAKKRRRKM